MKKKINIVLIIVVTGLWGTVMYKYLKQYLFKPELISPASDSRIYSNAKIIEKDTFEITPLVRDPFSDKNLTHPVSAIKKRTHIPTVKKEVKKPKPAVNYPRINYFGYIKSKDKPEMLVLLKVNGRLMKLKSNQTLDGIRVVKVYKDSVQVSFNGEIRSFQSE